jgi:GNAT superfamily N-acetyltransferase
VALPYMIRAYRSSDAHFVYASWLHSFERFRDFRVNRDVYYQEHHSLVTSLMGALTGVRLVAASKEDPDQIFGWLFGAKLAVGTVLDYAFVKPIYRKLGLAKALVHELGEPEAYTHRTDMTHRLVPSSAVFDPYLLFLPRR